MSGKNNGHLFVITGMDTFPGNKSWYKAVTSCQTKDALTFFQLFLQKSTPQPVKKWNLIFGSLPQLSHGKIFC